MTDERRAAAQRPAGAGALSGSSSWRAAALACGAPGAGAAAGGLRRCRGCLRCGCRRSGRAGGVGVAERLAAARARVRAVDRQVPHLAPVRCLASR